MSEVQNNSRLPNAPLQEVVLEAQWLPAISDNGEVRYDPDFELAQGRFEERLIEEFPVYKRVRPQYVPHQLQTGQAIHQYWKDEETYPVVQHGPCIATVNHGSNEYEWEHFQALVRRTLERLLESYRDDIALETVRLYYIDAMDLEEGFPILQSLADLKVDLAFNASGNHLLTNVNVNFSYALDNDSTLYLSVQNGQNQLNKAPALIWHTSVHRSNWTHDNNRQQRLEEIMAWCSYAHSITHELFFTMIKGKLYERFSKSL